MKVLNPWFVFFSRSKVKQGFFFIMNQIVDIIGYENLKRMHTIQYNVTLNLTRTEIERNRKIKVETFL